MSQDFMLDPIDDIDQIVLPKRVPRVERVPIVDSVEGVVVCERLWRLPTHHYAKRTRICPGKASCDIHKDTSLRVYFLCAVWRPVDQEVCWYQLPGPAAKCLMLAKKTMQRPLMGMSVIICRKWKAKNAPVVLRVNPYSTHTGELPKGLTPHESVQRCFFSDVEKPSTPGKKRI